MKKSHIFAAAVTGMMFASTAIADHHEPKKGEKETKKGSAKADAKSADSTKKVKCFGINECKGKSECDVKDAHGCAGANECKGKGWITVSLKDCTDKKGKVVN